MTAPKILMLDIETAPNKAYTWGLWNQNIGINQIVEPGYTLCWAAKWYGQSQKHAQFMSTHHDSREAMVEGIWKLLDEADAVVHYNGKKFDIPKLNLEFLLAGLQPPSPYWQIDLLAVCRSQFRFASNKLDYVCQQLGIGSKVQHKGMDLWHECMMGEDKAWKTMKRYNLQDTKLLDDLYETLLPWINSHPNLGLWDDSQDITCPNCGSHNVETRGHRTTKVAKYKRHHCLDCGKWSQGRRSVTTLKSHPGVIKG